MNVLFMNVAKLIRVLLRLQFDAFILSSSMSVWFDLIARAFRGPYLVKNLFISQLS